eukprot:6068179-Pleurochrysis_carterae.AAC.2
MGVRITAPPRTQASILVPMATNAGDASACVQHHESAAGSDATYRARWASGFSLRPPRLSVSLSDCTRPIILWDDHVWVATLEDNWGVDMWSARFTQAGDVDLSTMNHLLELLRSQLLQNIESDASSLDVNRTADTLVGSPMDNFSNPNDPCRALFPLLHQPAKMHREARSHTVHLIADTGPRSFADNASTAKLTSTGMAAARVDRVLSWVPRYAGAGNHGERAYFYWNLASTFVSALKVQLIAMQKDMSQHVLDASAVLGFIMHNQLYFLQRRNSVPLTLLNAVATPGEGA